MNTDDIKVQFVNFLRGVYGAETQVMDGSLPPLQVGSSFPAFRKPVNQQLGMMAQLGNPQMGMMQPGMMGQPMMQQPLMGQQMMSQPGMGITPSMLGGGMMQGAPMQGAPMASGLQQLGAALPQGGGMQRPMMGL